MPIYRLGDKIPKFLSEKFFVAKNAYVIGDVVIGENVSIWFGAVVRGDLANITVSSNSNIQENSVLHVDYDLPLMIEKGVTVGHAAVLHSCTIGRNCLIGMHAVILSGAKIEENSIIGAHSLIPQNKIIPSGSLVLGVPAKVIRSLTSEEIVAIKKSSEHYVHQMEVYQDKFQLI